MAEQNIKENLISDVEDISRNIEIPDSLEKNPEKKEISISSFSDKISDISVLEKNNDNKQNNSGSLVQSAKEKRVKKVENILEIDLADIYLKLSPNQQKKFKKKGEETSANINTLLDSAIIKTKKILSLIKEWLQMIPGVNRFFIEQLAKNKLDEIIKLKNK